jgi:hypothetical protein
VNSAAVLYRSVDPFTYSDFVFIIEHHAIDDELALALSAALLISLEIKELMDFLSAYSLRIPTIFCHLWSYVSPESQLGSILAQFSQVHFSNFCDDPSLCSKLVDFHLSHGNDLSPFIPILRSSMWANPTAAVLLARIALSSGDLPTAFNYLNAALHCKHWPSSHIDYQQPILTGPKTSVPYYSGSEKILVSSPIVGLKAETFWVTSSLIEAVGLAEFQDFVKNQIASRPVFGSIDSFTVWPPKNFAFTEEDFELMSLFDPGIESPETKMDVIAKLPYSDSFKRLITDVSGAMARSRDFLSPPKPPHHERVKEDALAVVVLALRLRSAALIEKGFAILKRRPEQCTTTVKLLLLRAVIGGFGPNLDDVLSVEVNQCFTADMNALAFVEDLAIGLDKTFS